MDFKMSELESLTKSYPGYAWVVETWQKDTPLTASASCGAVAVFTGGVWYANFELCKP
jgi:hypothetical protein